MSENCAPENCETCGQNCGAKADFTAHLAPGSSVRHVFAVMSGKGGVGKSLVSCMLANAMAGAGYRTAILDADITGPSIARAYDLDINMISGTADMLIRPAVTHNGISVMSANLLMENETDPIVWRGALIASAVRQFYETTFWEGIDYMLVDMPPGTGDVPLTVFQSLPVEGIIMVTSPQELVSMIVAKAVGMARMMEVPILGIVENMSYFVCPDCGKKHYIYGESGIGDIADAYGLSVLARIPVDPEIAYLIDSGRADSVDSAPMNKALGLITSLERFDKS